MQPRSGQGGQARRDERDDAMLWAREGGGTRGDQMREIRRRIEDDAYRSPEVAEEIARRILLSREL
jgi:hypothetical protein